MILSKEINLPGQPIVGIMSLWALRCLRAPAPVN